MKKGTRIEPNLLFGKTKKPCLRFPAQTGFLISLFRFYPVFEKILEITYRHRLVVEEALCGVTFAVTKEIDLFLGLNTFANNIDIHLIRHFDNT